ncbi:MAG: efflux RND transporter periplasmic adaptor subunit [Candidatus Curtissbacteria bacterium]
MMKFPRRKILSFIPKRFRQKKYLLAFLPLVLFWLLINRGAGDTGAITTVPAEYKAIESQVAASGAVESASQAVLRFGGSGKVVWLSVHEGQYVWPGQAIASLDATHQSVAVRQAQQDVVAADAVLSQVYDEMKKYTAAENFDQKIRRTNAEKTKNQAYDALISAKKSLSESTIYAPFGGTIVSLPIVSGQQVTPATDIAELANLGNIEFVADVDETDINRVHEGQSAKILLDAFGDREFESTVFRVGSKSKVSTTGATAYEVIFYLPSDESFRLGMSGEAQIVTDRTGEAVVVPQEAIVDDKYVWVREGDTYTKREIEKGLESDTEVEITKSLSADDTVVISGTGEISKKSLLQKIMGIFAK